MILVVNAGSSSLRLAAYEAVDHPALVADGHLQQPGAADAEVVRGFLRRHRLGAPGAVVHRVVHGGTRFTAPVRVDGAVEREIERLGALAPLHNPVALAWLRASRDVLAPGAVEVAAFDTAFYADLPEVAATYALPPALCRRHEIRRYGFHGLAHRAMLDAWAAGGGDPDARVISLQLGSGCSITASRAGRPMDTSMGFSPLEGLVMATRAGDLDPAVVLHLLEQGGHTSAGLGELLNRGAGLLGLSGRSGDMRTLLADDDPAARLAVDVFCHRLRRYLGAFLAVLEGADAVLVGGGIGEHSPEIRRRALAGFEWAGIRLDPVANRDLPAAGGTIHRPDSEVALRVTPVDEMIIMARAALPFLGTRVTAPKPDPHRGERP